MRVSDHDGNGSSPPPGWHEETERLRAEDRERAEHWDETKALANRLDHLTAEVRVLSQSNAMATVRLEREISRANQSIDYLVQQMQVLINLTTPVNVDVSDVAESLGIPRKARRKK